MLHTNINKSHVNINRLQVNVIILPVDIPVINSHLGIIYFACREQSHVI